MKAKRLRPGCLFEQHGVVIMVDRMSSPGDVNARVLYSEGSTNDFGWGENAEVDASYRPLPPDLALQYAMWCWLDDPCAETIAGLREAAAGLEAADA